MGKRGASGTGHIRQRKDGLWEAQILVNGKLKSVYGKTQVECRQKLTALQASIDAGTYVQASKLTVEQWLNTWHSEYCNSVKDSTRIAYRSIIDAHIIPALGNTKLTALTPTMCQRFYNDLTRKKGLSSKTTKNIHGTLHEALKRAVIARYIPFNPADNADLPRIEKTEIDPLDAPEIAKLLNVLDDGLYSTIIKIDLFTGLREGEILGLQWSCVDFEQGTITIDKQLSRPRERGAVYKLTSVKNNKPRTITPAPFVMQLLRHQRQRQIEQRLHAGNVWDDHGIPDLVFTYDDGKFLNYNVILRQLRKSLREAGLPEKRFHDLRHTYAVSALQAGDDVKTLQESLGHHDAAFTLNRYGHVTESMRRASSQRMESFINALGV